VVAPPARAVAGWQVLANLLAALGGPRYQSANEVFMALCLELGLGAGRTHAAVGSLGTPLAQWSSKDSGDASGTGAAAPACA